MNVNNMTSRLLRQSRHRHALCSLGSALNVAMTALFCHITPAAHATGWYVDNAAKGAGNGTNWANAWTDMTEVVWGGSGVGPGDTLYISGGSTSKTYTNVWSAKGDGTVDNRITIRVGQDAGHNGHVRFDGAAHGDTFPVGQFTALSGNYITLDGAVDGENRMSYINIVNTNSRSYGYSVLSSSVSASIVRFVTFSNVNNGIRLGSGDGSRVHNCEFTVRGDSAIMQTVDGTGWDKILVYSNKVTVCVKPGGGGPDGFQVRPGTSVFNNRFRAKNVDFHTSGQHPDFIQGLDPRWFKFYGNDCVNYGDAGVTLAPMLGASGLQDILIFNNVFRQTTLIDNVPEYIRFLTVDKTYNGFYRNVYIVNNLFADGTNANTSIVATYRELADAGTQGTNNWIANNIWVGSSRNAYNPMFNIQFTNNPSVWTITNNIYNPMQGSSGHVVYYGAKITVSDFIANYDPAGTRALPQFWSYIPFAEDNDFRLQAGDNVARDKGLDFSHLFTTDHDGAPRTGKWDIGPFEFRDFGSRPAAPLALRISPQ